MTDRPILFSAPMVRAILDGTKTQTRRIVKPQPLEASPGPGIRAALYRPGDFIWPDKVPGCSTISCKPHGPDGWAEQHSPYGKAGDWLWVRETWQMAGGDSCFWYAATDSQADCGASPVSRWRPSIHMPRRASRITLEITRVRVERLQDISEADARAEGAPPLDPHWPIPADGRGTHASGYRRLWEQINGPDSWASNPWVWVVEFRRIS